MTTWYEKLSAALETKAFRLTFFTILAVLVGGLVELPPFFLMGKVQKTANLKPYNALELAGRDVYQQEGCFYCHTQLVRPFKWETDRFDPGRKYGPEPYSKAGEFVYEHPFLWGSKRIGPDLARLAGRSLSAEWHKEHLINPRSSEPNSIMPAYPWLFKTPLSAARVQSSMKALKLLGVPYSAADIQNAPALVRGKTEGDALVAYLLALGRDAIVNK